MQTAFKKHQKVRLLRSPLAEDIEPYTDPPKEIKPGMEGEINLILPNGTYHIRIFNEKKETIAYAAVDEDCLESLESTG